MEIRKADVTDDERIAELLTQLDYDGTAAFVKEKILQLNERPEEELLVAVEEERVVGVLSIHFMPQLAMRGDIARISYFCVEERSRSRGVGRAMEAYCEQLAQARGCDRIEVHCEARRERAHAFYLRQGYTESPKYLVKALR